jgi:hypothetical protein
MDGAHANAQASRSEPRNEARRKLQHFAMRISANLWPGGTVEMPPK